MHLATKKKAIKIDEARKERWIPATPTSNNTVLKAPHQMELVEKKLAQTSMLPKDGARAFIWS